MKIKKITIESFRRFTNLIVKEIPSTARLVVLVGPNGSGKSSLFDAFLRWSQDRAYGGGPDPLYHHKKNPGTSSGPPGKVEIDFHDLTAGDRESLRKIFYIRSAYRNDPDFSSGEIRRLGAPTRSLRFQKLIDDDKTVSENYQRLVAETVDSVYSGELDEKSVRELRESLIQKIRDSMGRVFKDLVLRGPGRPLEDGTFLFEKGSSSDFHYKNLSAGEKGAFDLLLDFAIKKMTYTNTVFCIDEPDLHMNTAVQGKLLSELVGMLPETSQLWIATHSIGMLRRARQMKKENPDDVVFLSFHEHDFDQPVVIEPTHIDRRLWGEILHVAFDDLAVLVAPEIVVLCEGKPTVAGSSDKAQFDASCYRKIFSHEIAEVDFLSLGSAGEVQKDQIGLASGIQALVPGTTVVKLIDRDDRSKQEVEELREENVRVLSRRHLESYLLDDEVLEAYCESQGKPEVTTDLLAAKAAAMTASQSRGNPRDDLKSAAGEIYNQVKVLLNPSQPGNNAQTFMRDSLAPLIKPGMTTYEVLKADVFSEV